MPPAGWGPVRSPSAVLSAGASVNCALGSMPARRRANCGSRGIAMRRAGMADSFTQLSAGDRPAGRQECLEAIKGTSSLKGHPHLAAQERQTPRRGRPPWASRRRRRKPGDRKGKTLDRHRTLAGFRLSFGVHRNKPLAEVPASYLRWMLRQDAGNQTLAADIWAAKQYLQFQDALRLEHRDKHEPSRAPHGAQRRPPKQG